MINQIKPDLVWKEITNPDTKGGYKISNTGDIYSNKSLKMMRQKLSRGYKKLTLTIDGVPKLYRVARLVALAFIPNPENKPITNHINGIKTDNRVENLEWCTYSENNRHAYQTGLKEPTIRTDEMNKNQSKRMRGRKLTEEHKKKISQGLEGKQNSLGYRHTEEAKQKIREANKRRYSYEK